ncbi:cell envelope integrity protein CreD [Sphingobacterium sp. SGR-19]|uniref:cell envelope integrity protein CreD n=1 Tax=Sphingobacterium sp. SGR-19 TaxID=2710886 RepID=UPI0013EDADDF|nr:cell envelope integrity protein CreD [Sphingobacterium sp. SGR-19]NGM67159.1 cell envelope integrity protein CreD [Sphingobacterium sp. SGR-19]
MENQNTPPAFPPSPSSFFERLANSVILKLGIILFLVLLLLIPMESVKDLIRERKNRDQAVSNEIASKWGNTQVVSGPIIGIPYTYSYNVNTTDEKGEIKAEKHVEKDYVFLVSKTLDVKSTVEPTYLKRGIYQTVVYNATIALRGEFDEIDLAKLDLNPEDLSWENAKVFIGLSDLKGIKAIPKLSMGQDEVEFEVGNADVSLFEQTMVANVDLSDRSTKNEFAINLDIRGSRNLTVFPTSNETSIIVSGIWDNPSFNGGFLPEDRTISEQDFTAKWRIPSFSRKFPQQWKGARGRMYQITNYEITDVDYPVVAIPEPSVSSSGTNVQLSTEQDMVQVNFLESVNNYQKTTRVAKYGILVVLLTFTSLFFTEVIKKQRVHIVQYVLIGCAMVLFYSLLLALSEHTGFNWGYLIAAIATIMLISSFIFGITKDKKIAFIFSGILSAFYIFIFSLMQLQDYSLIVGTIGVFVILALLMRLSTRVNWYQFEKK